MKREIIEIDEDRCDGCGQCVPNCHEGALQIIDGKARLISDLFCDGLGNCIGHCPRHAISIVKREADVYDEKKVMEQSIIPKGKNTLKAHLKHLKDHGADDYLNQALDYLKENNIDNPMEEDTMKQGCPGSRIIDMSKSQSNEENGQRQSHLTQWPVQLHLLSPHAPYFKEADILLAADCTAFSTGDFHKDFLKGKSIAIACPKLDSDQESYLEKLISMIDDSGINTLTVLTMEVPCCQGLLQTAKKAVENSERKVPIKSIVIGIDGNIKEERWI